MSNSANAVHTPMPLSAPSVVPCHHMSKNVHFLGSRVGCPPPSKLECHMFVTRKSMMSQAVQEQGHHIKDASNIAG
eukprot:285938-Pelagomonas_calceolata.AAC.1